MTDTHIKLTESYRREPGAYYLDPTTDEWMPVDPQLYPIVIGVL